MPTAAEIEARQKYLKRLERKKKQEKAERKRYAKRTQKLKAKLSETTGKKRRKNLKKKVSKVRTKKRASSKELDDLRKKYQAGRRIREVTPADPGVKAPVIPPFLKGEDMISVSEAEAKLSGELQNLDYALENLRLDTSKQKADIARQRRIDLNDANEAAAARGLFRSSIRDADLFDVEAAAAVNRNLLDRALDVASLDTQRQKVAAQGAYDSFMSGIRQKMVENAKEATPDTGPFLVKPTDAQKSVTIIDPHGDKHKTKPIKPKPPEAPKPPKGGGKKGGGKKGNKPKWTGKDLGPAKPKARPAGSVS